MFVPDSIMVNTLKISGNMILLKSVGFNFVISQIPQMQHTTINITVSHEFTELPLSLTGKHT